MFARSLSIMSQFLVYSLKLGAHRSLDRLESGVVVVPNNCVLLPVCFFCFVLLLGLHPTHLFHVCVFVSS